VQSFDETGELKEKGANVHELDVTALLGELKTMTKPAVDIHGRWMCCLTTLVSKLRCSG
jgi:hypothetical protein